jgi:ribosome-associated translation inhibitor RaiA
MDQQQQAGQDKPVREREAQVEARPLDDVATALAEHEGMRLFIEAIPESRSMDSKRPALKTEFLSRADKAAAREALKAKLALWQRLLKDADGVDALLKAAQDRKKAVEKTMKANQKVALESTAELAESYGALARFFLNIGETGEGKLHFLNAERDQIGDMQGKKFFQAITDFVVERFRQFDLAKNIGGIVLPGMIGGKDTVSLYSKLAYDNMCRLYTDYRNYDTFEDLKREFAEENIAAADKELANTVMTAVWMEGRKGDKELGVEPVYLPGSMFMAAKRYEAREKGNIAQPAFGERYGSVNGASEVKLDLRKDQVEALAEMGLVVAQKVRGKVVFYGDESLHRGSKLERRKYYIVQLDDWIFKVMTDYGNRRAGELNKDSMRKDVREQIQKFMNGLKAAGVIEKVVEVDVQQNREKEDETDISIKYVPYKAARVFNIHGQALDGKSGGTWDKGEQ